MVQRLLQSKLVSSSGKQSAFHSIPLSRLVAPPAGTEGRSKLRRAVPSARHSPCETRAAPGDGGIRACCVSYRAGAAPTRAPRCFVPARPERSHSYSTFPTRSRFLLPVRTAPRLFLADRYWHTREPADQRRDESHTADPARPPVPGLVKP